jgi:hypothetical protein
MNNREEIINKVDLDFKRPTFTTTWPSENFLHDIIAERQGGTDDWIMNNYITAA